MIKRIALIFLVLTIIGLAVPVLVQAQAQIKVLDSTTAANFPQTLSFKLKAESAAGISSVVLRYKVDKLTFAPVSGEITPTFTAGTTVEANWSWDMVKSGGLPPGAKIEYRWVIQDNGGSELETSPAVVQFNDVRYSWRSLSVGKVTFYWYQGDQAFVQQLMDAAQKALEKLAKDTGASLEKPVSIYIYGSAEALKGAMVFPQEWTGGVAFSEFAIIAIGIAPSQLAWGKGAVAHELAHLVNHQMTYNGYGSIPTWLEEGLAMYAEGELDSGSKGLLNRAITQDKVFSVRSLSSSFPASGDDALVAYAQSFGLIEFLVSKHGRDKMLLLLNTFKQGSTPDDALQKAYGFNMDGLDAAWRSSVGLKPRPISAAATPTPQPLPTIIPFGTTPTPPALSQPTPTPAPSPVERVTPTPTRQTPPVSEVTPTPLAPPTPGLASPETKRPLPVGMLLLLSVVMALVVGMAVLVMARRSS